MGFGSGGGGGKFGSGRGDLDGDLTVRGTTPTLTIGDGGEEDTAVIFDGNAKDFYVGLDDSADKLVIGEGSTVGTNSILTLTDDTVTIGDGATVDTMLVFDGNAQDYRIGIDDGTDFLEIGHGSAHGTRAAIIIDNSGDVRRIGTDTHTSGQFLKYDGTKFVLSSVSDAGSVAANGITTGDGAVSIVTTAGDITLDAQEGDANIVFKGTDGSSDVTALTLSMADAGTAVFNHDIHLDSDGSILAFGDNQEITLTHEHNLGLILEGNGVSACPVLTLKNTNADATGGTLKFDKNGSSPADSDVIGNITFVSEDDGSAVHTYATIVGSIDVDAAGEESGKIVLNVATHDGDAPEAGLTLVGGDADSKINATIGKGAASETTIAGTLIMGSTAAMTNAGLLSVGNQSNITGVGALASGTIAAGFGAIDNGTSGIRTNTFTAETSIVPDASGGADIGSTSAEWGDVYLADEKAIKFGNEQDITLTHVQDTGLILASVASATPVFTLKTTNSTTGTSGELQFLKDAADTQDGEVLGRISFYGEDEGNNNTHFASIVASIGESDETDEAGILELQVAESDGTTTDVTTGLKLTGAPTTDGKIDVEIGAGTTSTTTIAGTLDLGDRNITNVGDIDCDSISIADAASGLLIDTNGSNNQTSALVLTDNLANSFAIRESSNVYMGFTTTDGSESVSISKDLLATAAVTFKSDVDGEKTALVLYNEDDDNDADGAVSVRFDLEDTSGTAVDSGKIRVKKRNAFTSTASTQDSRMDFYVTKDGTLNRQASFMGGREFRFHNSNSSVTVDASSGNNTAGKSLTIKGGAGTGNGAGGSLIFQTADGLESTADAVNVHGTALTLADDLLATFGGAVKLADDKTLTFGTNDDASFEYDEDGTDRLLYAGAGLRISDDVKLEFGTGGDATIEYDEDGTDTLSISGAATKFTVDGVEIENSNSGSGPALLIDNDNVDANALDIDAANTTANVLDIAAPDLTSGIALSIDATGGNCVEAMKISHTVTTTTANTSFPGYAALHIDSARASDTTNAAHMTGIAIDMDESNANGGSNVMRGLWVTPTLTHDTDNSANPVVKGAEFIVTGGLNGTGTKAMGLDIEVSGADFNQGIHLKSGVTGTPSSPVGNHIKLISGASDTDTFQVSVLGNGETVLKSIDSGSGGSDTDAHIHVIADGNIEMSTATGGEITLKTATANAAGGGFDLSGAVIATVLKLNGEIITTIQVDLTGLSCSGVEKDVIGENGVAAAYITQITDTVNGFIYKAEMMCVETPNYSSGTVQDDINLVVSSVSHAEDAAYDSGVGSNALIVNAGPQSRGTFADSLGSTIDGLDNKYLYLAAGNSVGDDGAYNAGKLLIKLYGAVIA